LSLDIHEAEWEDLSHLDRLLGHPFGFESPIWRWNATDFLRRRREDVAIVLRADARYGPLAARVKALDSDVGPAASRGVC
jgi:hypothetical protein